MSDPTAMDELFKRRILFVRGDLDEQRAGDAAARLMTLDAVGDEPVTLYLDCTCTSLDAAFTLMDVIDLMGAPVHTTATGRVEGPAVGVLAVSAHRRISPNARIRLHDPDTTTITGNANQLADWAAHHQQALARFHRRLAEATGRPVEHVEADCGQGRYLDAEQARAYGLADEIAWPASA
jgi:ATP-dependent Clp protease protease subunit